jgi:hypothetical protein
MLSIASANASISSTCKIATWKAKDAIIKPSAEKLQARVASICINAQQEYTRLSTQFLKADGTIKDVTDLVAPYKNARYPYMLCIDYMFRAQKDCDTQMQYLTYAASLDSNISMNAQELSQLQDILKQACITVGDTDGYKKDLAQQEHDIKNGW